MQKKLEYPPPPPWDLNLLYDVVKDSLIAFILKKSGNVDFSITHAIETLYLNSTVMAGWLQSTRAHHSVPCCSKGYFCKYFTSENNRH